MRAVVLDQFGDASLFRMGDIPTPPVKKGEVRIKIKAAAFNPVDWKMRKGFYHSPLPIVLGADCSGVIDEIGEGVSDFAKGDEVAAIVFGQGSNGTYAEYVSVPAVFVVKKPKNLSIEQAAAFPLVGLTALRSMRALYPGKPAFIAGGSGGVGALAVQLARHLKASPIFTTAGSEESASCLINKIGHKKEHILFYKGLSVEQMKEKLIAMNGGKLIPATFDFVGGAMKDLCIEVADFQGNITSIIFEKEDVFNRLLPKANMKSLAFHFIFVGAEAFLGPPESWNLYQKQLRELSQFIEEKLLIIPEPTIVGPLAVETVQKAHALLEEGHAKGKLIMKF
jgi:NADPH2:quinone reductase